MTLQDTTFTSMTRGGQCGVVGECPGVGDKDRDGTDLVVLQRGTGEQRRQRVRLRVSTLCEDSWTIPKAQTSASVVVTGQKWDQKNIRKNWFGIRPKMGLSASPVAADDDRNLHEKRRGDAELVRG